MERDSELVGALPTEFALFAMPLDLDTQSLTPELIGVEQLNGRPSYRVRIAIDEVALGIGEDSLADLWIDVEDNTLMKLVTETALTDDMGGDISEGSLLDGDIALTVTALISDYDSPVDIQAPEVR